MLNRKPRYSYAERCFLGVWLKPGKASFNSAYGKMAEHLKQIGLPIPSRLHIKRIANDILKRGNC